jgi:hypothetical protein
LFQFAVLSFKVDINPYDESVPSKTTWANIQIQKESAMYINIWSMCTPTLPILPRP